MPTPSTTLRLLLSQLDDVGSPASKSFDKTITLAGLQQWTCARRLTLAAAGADVPLTFTDALQVVVYSHDNAFKLRLGAGETLLANLKVFAFATASTATGAKQTSVLLTGNGTTPSDIEVWISEKPST